jgi:hypothetical protein
MTSNVCPFCGGEVKVWSLPIGNDAHFAKCKTCDQQGPIVTDKADAEHAFCHPAHITAGMVMVSVDDFDDFLSEYESLYDAYKEEVGCEAGRDPNLMERLTAAIDAAKSGEKR